MYIVSFNFCSIL